MVERRQGMSPAPPPPPACSNKGGRGRASSHLSSLLLSTISALLLLLQSPTISAKDVFTNHFLVHLHPSHGHPDPPALARDIARRNGFHSLGPLLNSPHEFHFVHEGLSHARHKRSLPHSRKLKTDPQVHRVYQQTGIRRVKRGCRTEQRTSVATTPSLWTTWSALPHPLKSLRTPSSPTNGTRKTPARTAAKLDSTSTSKQLGRKESPGATSQQQSWTTVSTTCIRTSSTTTTPVQAMISAATIPSRILDTRTTGSTRTALAVQERCQPPRTTTCAGWGWPTTAWSPVSGCWTSPI